MLLKRITLFFAALFMGWASAYAVDIEKFDSVSEMIEAFGDYSADDESFLVLSEDPQHIRLTKMTVKGDPESVVEAELKRAVMYGVYQSFIHTDIPAIKVTAQPMLTTFNPHSQKLLDKPVYEVSVTRDQALEAVQEFLDIDELTELKTQGQFGVSWSDGFNSLYYEDRDPGLNVFYETVVKASK